MRRSDDANDHEFKKPDRSKVNKFKDLYLVPDEEDLDEDAKKVRVVHDKDIFLF